MKHEKRKIQTKDKKRNKSSNPICIFIAKRMNCQNKFGLLVFLKIKALK